MTSSQTLPRYLVKIGGSVIDGGHAEDVIARLPFDCSDVVFVTGGGHKADAVRQAQQRDGFDDRTAHRMALQAMNEMADDLCRSVGTLKPVSDLAGISRVLASGKRPVVQPWPALANDVLLPETWDATSDAVAARLAEIIGTAVVLVKSVTIDPAMSAAALAKAGIIDDEFPRIVRRSFLKWAIIGPEASSSSDTPVHWHQG